LSGQGVPNCLMFVGRGVVCCGFAISIGGAIKTGSKLDMGGGPTLDEGGSELDDNTTLIDNPLEDDPLKDPSYVEPGVPNPITNTSKTDKLKAVKGVHPFRGIQASGTHTRKPMSNKGTGSEKSPKSVSSTVPSGQSSVGTSQPWAPTSQPPSSVPSAEVPVATSPPSAPTSQPL